MRTVTFLGTENDFVYFTILKKDSIKNKYKRKKDSPSYNRIMKIIEHYKKQAYIRLYPNGACSFVLGESPYG